ncbi:hypothetical protein ISN45_Aa05g005690 [Arabidopsis thaliana x Arabidopsis arenosa]|uniref:Uncharacterized protein n=1 Tax=Arabidopsis thaliana x Arabidopsis arenosa TaxID=1240361 RepID=A0A8T1ZKH2_9BRAS|nr:hypothetical protein ISN45_Aa05g005690 [Arabidopsis thaliana x Arabidopsis arenosa]
MTKPTMQAMISADMKRHINALLDGYELAGYLDCSTAPPPAMITTNNITTANPDFAFWKRQDKLLYSAVIGTITASVQSLLSRADTSAEIWSTLASTYSQPSRGHIRILKLQVEQWTKGSRTIDEYIQGHITRLDQLAALGKPLEHDKQIEAILKGLSEEYKPIVDQIACRDTPPMIPDLHERFRNHKVRLLSAPNMATPSPFPASANAVQHHNNNHRYNNSNNNNNYDRRYNNNDNNNSN